jgi:hypothetical protein
MRALLPALCVVACSVPDKNPATDGGIDAPTNDGNDTGAPDTRITSAPTEFSNQRTALFEFESDDPSATFTCSFDEEPAVPCTSPASRALADGPHGFVVRAVDPAGNSDDTPAEQRWTIDTVAPDTALTGRPPLADNSINVRFDFTATEENVTFECRVDSGDFVACTTGSTFGPLGDGPHSFAVRALDRAGNVDPSPAAYAWTINTAMPDTQIVSGPEGQVASTTATFSFVSPDAGAGATFTCSLDGGAELPCASPTTFQNLAERVHSFTVRVRDAVGNVDPTPATRTWTVDLSAPETTITMGPQGAMPSASASFTFTSSEPGSTFECKLDTAPFAACTSPSNLMMLAQGQHTFSVRAIDGAAHADPTPATRTWTVDTVAPDVTITAGPAPGATSGPRVGFTFTVSEGSPECSLDGAALAPCTSPVAFNAADGAHQFRIQAVDDAGNVGGLTRSWTVACAPPQPAGASGLLHLDDPGQVQANAVAGGVDAVLGDDATDEAADPTAGAGRFGGGFVFTQNDHISWPAALDGATAFTVELYVRPDAAAGSRTIFATGDGRLQIRVTGGTQISVVVTESGGAASFAASSGAIAAGAWHHVVASLAEPTLRLWVDGARFEAGGVSLGNALSFDLIRIGDGVVGTVDEVRVAQTAATTDDAALGAYCPQ